MRQPLSNMRAQALLNLERFSPYSFSTLTSSYSTIPVITMPDMLMLSPVGERVWMVLLCVLMCSVLLCCGADGCGYTV